MPALQSNRNLFPLLIAAILLFLVPRAAQTSTGPSQWPETKDQNLRGPMDTRPSTEIEPEVPQNPGRLTEQKTGTFMVRPGMRFKLLTEIGNVKIRTAPKDLPPGQMRYVVRVEADRTQPEAEKLVKQFTVSARTTPDGVWLSGQAPWKHFRGRIWVTFDVSLPRGAQVEVQTQAGSIETDDIEGRTVLITAGGNIFAGRLAAGTSAGARLETSGGHITVSDVYGGLTAVTAGGHITAGNVQGDAVLRTGGGHLRVGTISGSAQLETGGGNILVQKASARVNATTAGGRIEFGEITGGVRARTGGGGIRVGEVSGPTELAAISGSIYLTRVSGAVNASTESGGITARFVGEAKAQAPSQLVCSQGDITVYISRSLPLTIDASIEMASDHRIYADPGLGLKVNASASGAGGRSVRGEASVNGGGQVLKLRTVSGNIRLRFNDGAEISGEYLYTLSPEEKAKFEAEKAKEIGEALNQPRAKEPGPSGGTLSDWQRKLREMFTGKVPVNALEMRSRLVHSPRPAYPQAAKLNRLQGMVHLDVQIGKDGTVEDVQVISGHPLLASAAAEAVRKWRYQPYMVNGSPAKVLTAVYIDFRLD